MLMQFVTYCDVIHKMQIEWCHDTDTAIFIVLEGPPERNTMIYAGVLDC